MTLRDPLKLLGDWLIAQALADRDSLDGFRKSVQAAINAGVDFAMRAPYPAAREVDQDVYA